MGEHEEENHEDTGKNILRPVQELNCLLCEDKENTIFKRILHWGPLSLCRLLFMKLAHINRHSYGEMLLCRSLAEDNGALCYLPSREGDEIFVTLQAINNGIIWKAAEIFLHRQAGKARR
jgi:hypothetical protein